MIFGRDAADRSRVGLVNSDVMDAGLDELGAQRSDPQKHQIDHLHWKFRYIIIIKQNKTHKNHLSSSTSRKKQSTWA